MNKIILPVLLFMMFIPYVVNAETCDTDKITIENIAIESKSDNVEELSQATANGKSINLNLSMSEVGDSVEYKFIVKNDSNEDYELDKTSLNLNSDYINYSFETEDNSNIVKAKSSKNVSLRVEYKTEVPEDKFESGSFSDNKTIIVQLSNGNTVDAPDMLKNPNTGVQSYILILIIILLISGSLYILLKKKKYAKFMMLIIGAAILIPINAYALCKCEIKIESNIEIESQYDYWCHIIWYNSTQYNVFKYKKGMTWREYYESEDPNIVKIEDGCINNIYGCNAFNMIYKRTNDNGIQIGLGPKYTYSPGGDYSDDNGNPYYIGSQPNPNLKIVSKEEFCYGYIPD